MHTTTHSAVGGQKREWEPLGLELLKGVSYHVGVGSRPWPLFKNSWCSYPLSHPSSPNTDVLYVMFLLKHFYIWQIRYFITFYLYFSLTSCSNLYHFVPEKSWLWVAENCLYQKTVRTQVLWNTVLVQNLQGDMYQPTQELRTRSKRRGDWKGQWDKRWDSAEDDTKAPL